MASHETIITDQPYQGVHNLDSYVTLYCNFAYDGTAVDVDSGSESATITKDGSPVSPTIMVPFGKDDTGETGVYSISFLTDGLTAGTYDVVFAGEYQGTALTNITGQFQLYQLPTAQALIDRVRRALWDADCSQYLGFFQDRAFKNPDLYAALQNALEWIQTCPPSRQASWTWDTIPDGFAIHLVQGAKWYAIQARLMLEIRNQMQVSDEVNININMQQGYNQAASSLEKWKNEAMQAKRMWQFEDAAPRGIISTRFPFTFLRVMSLLPSSQRIFVGGGTSLDIGYSTGW